MSEPTSVKPTPAVCSNCGEGLCGMSPALKRCKHGYGFMESRGAHHNDSSPAHERCTRAKLIGVRGCFECHWPRVNDWGQLWCSLSGDDDDGINLEEYVEPNPMPPECPLLKDGKPGPGVRIVAVQQATTEGEK